MMKTATSLATTTQAYTLKYELLDVCVTCTEKMKKKKQNKWLRYSLYKNPQQKRTE